MELLEFVVTTTYFTFWGGIYQQRFGTAMGSLVSPVIANLLNGVVGATSNSYSPSEL